MKHAIHFNKNNTTLKYLSTNCAFLFMLIINHCHYNIFVRIENNRFLCYGYNSGNEYGSTGRPLVWIVRICCIKANIKGKLIYLNVKVNKELK